MGPSTRGFGTVVGHPELTVAALYVEHAICLVSHRAESAGPSIGPVGEEISIVMSGSPCA
jgi:hypothetical protein